MTTQSTNHGTKFISHLYNHYQTRFPEIGKRAPPGRNGAGRPIPRLHPPAVRGRHQERTRISDDGFRPDRKALHESSSLDTRISFELLQTARGSPPGHSSKSLNFQSFLY